MGKKGVYFLTIILVFAIGFGAGFVFNQDYFNKSNLTENKLTQIRIGWQIPLATQGQIVQVLKNTDLLKEHNLKPKFFGFSYGGPQSEAALAGDLDVIFVGDQPAINLIARGGKWKIVSRLFYTRTAIMVPLSSEINSLADLKNKTVASPFGSVAHREAILKEQSAGLIPEKNVKNIHLDILEISNLVQLNNDDKSWGEIDAVTVWEPSTSLFEMNKLARVIGYTPTLGVIAISDDFIQRNPEQVREFINTVRQSWFYFSQNIDKVNKWYIEDAKLPYTKDILDSAAKVEPNYSAKSIDNIDLNLTESHIETLEKGAKWALENKYTSKLANIRNAINTTFLK